MTSEDEPASEIGPESGYETRIDQLWEDARSGPGDAPSDEQAGRFLDAVLAEGLFCPVAPPASDPPPQTESESFAPMTIARDGVETFCLFDTVERLADSDLEASEFVAAPGRVFFQLAAEAGAQIALNPGVARTDTLFSAETVAMIAALSDAAEQEALIGADQAVSIYTPPEPSEALLAALSARLAAAEALLREAWLIDVRQEDLSDDADGAGAAREESLGLTLALVAAHEGDAALAALARDLSRLGSVLLPETGLDVAILAEGERALEAARRVGLGFQISAG